MANRNTQGFPSPEEDPRFHDTYQFLRRYRDATYSLKVVVHQMEHQFKLQYDNDIDKFLDSMLKLLSGMEEKSNSCLLPTILLAKRLQKVTTNNLTIFYTN